MNILGRNTPLGQRRHQTFHHRRRAADVKLVMAVGQGAFYKLNIHMSLVLKVAAMLILWLRLAVGHCQVKVGVCGCELYKL